MDTKTTTGKTVFPQLCKIFGAALLLLLLATCRKFDRQAMPPSLVPTQGFFSVPDSAHPLVKRAAAGLRVKDSSRPFAQNLARYEGLPVWGKAMIAARPLAHSSRSTNQAAADSLVLVPLVLGGTEYVNGYLECAVTDTIGAWLVRAGDYKQYGYDTTGGKLTAATIAKLCMAFEYEIWGHAQFALTDGRLLQSLFPIDPLPRYALVTVAPVAPTANGRAIVRPFNSDVTVFYNYGMEAFQNGLTNNYNLWWSTSGYGGIGSTISVDNASGGVLPTGGGSGTPTNIGNTGWYSYPYIGTGHWAASGFQVTMQDGQAINNFTLNNIDMDDLDSCRQLILKKLLNTNGVNLLGRILAKVDRGVNEPLNIEKFQVNYKMVPLPANTHAETGEFKFDTVTKIFKATVFLNDSVVTKSTDLFVAQLLIHETLHAYLASLAHRIFFGATLQNLQQMGYDSIFQRYVDTLLNRSPQQIIEILQDPEYDHNYWTGEIITKLAEALQLYDGSAIPNFNYYSYLSWKGLYNTRVWIRHWSNYSLQPPHNWPPIGLYTTEDSTRGLPYALTEQRLADIHNSIISERLANDLAKGKKPIAGGCY